MQKIKPVVGPQYCAPHTTEFTVRKKAWSFSDGDFLVTDAEGKLFFRVDGRMMSIKCRRVLLDKLGNPVVRAHRKILTLHERWYVYRGDGSETNEADHLFTVKKSAILQILPALDVFLASNGDENNPDFTLKGNFLERSCTVYRGDQIIAEVKRKFTAGNVLLVSEISYRLEFKTVLPRLIDCCEDGI